jgi:RNA polymerase sigma-70 factor (ECF subfamily)
LVAQRRRPQGAGDTDMVRLLEAQPDPSGEDTALFDAEYRRRLFHWAADRVRGEFSDATWGAFWAAAVDGRSAQQAAEALGTTPGAVYRCKSRVMARLRQEIKLVEAEGIEPLPAGPHEDQ